jgi:hypothetical protein
MRDLVGAVSLDSRVEGKINPGADDSGAQAREHGAMSATEYLINAVFVLLVVRQAHERELDTKSLVMPLVLVAFVAHTYLHSIPAAGNDLVLIAALAAVGLGCGAASGFATHVRIGREGRATARVGWSAAVLLIVGISSRMLFVFALSHGFEPTIRGFSAAHDIGAAAWSAALVTMAVVEVATRVVIVHARGARCLSSMRAPQVV